MVERLAGAAIKGQLTLRKWDETQNPEIDEPYETVDIEQWIEDGEVVTDPERIAELEAGLEQDES